jgi:hypothetical protein
MRSPVPSRGAANGLAAVKSAAIRSDGIWVEVSETAALAIAVETPAEDEAVVLVAADFGGGLVDRGFHVAGRNGDRETGSGLGGRGNLQFHALTCRNKSNDSPKMHQIIGDLMVPAEGVEPTHPHGY